MQAATVLSTGMWSVSVIALWRRTAPQAEVTKTTPTQEWSDFRAFCDVWQFPTNKPASTGYDQHEMCQK